MINKESKIYIAGHKGMVGSACWRILEEAGYKNIIGKSSNHLDLRNQKAVNEFLTKERPDAIIDAAAKVGGILANKTYPFEFLMYNMQIQNNLINSAHELEIPNFIFLGSSCIYPKLAPQPIKEEYLLTGELEVTNEWYAIAKISGVKLIEALKKEYNRNYVALMPTNLYGPNDNFDLKSSHVLPALIRKFHSAKINNENEVELWGTGSPLREFLHVDDLALAVKYFLESKSDEHLYNIGSGQELSILSLAYKIKNIIGYEGKINWDKTKPDGTPRKLLNSDKIRLKGVFPKIKLEEGINSTYQWYLNNLNKIK